MDQANLNTDGQTPEQAAPPEQSADSSRSRRAFLNSSARKLAYAAPLVLLFHPKPACASNGSTLTYWDPVEGKAKQQ